MPGEHSHLEEMADEIFAVTVQSWRARVAGKHTTSSELSESQFLTLNLLAKETSTLTVGELQRAIGVLPAQMSRIIRSLEDGFDHKLIKCELNQSDKRKIDVTLTPAGQKVYEEFKASRLAKTMELLQALSEQDRRDFVRICRQINEFYRKNESDRQPTK